MCHRTELSLISSSRVLVFGIDLFEYGTLKSWSPISTPSSIERIVALVKSKLWERRGVECALLDGEANNP
jgi:hypothetical protein